MAVALTQDPSDAADDAGMGIVAGASTPASQRSSGRSRLWDRWWRNQPVIERVRLCFTAVAVANLVVQLPGAVASNAGILPVWLAALTATALSLVWVCGLRAGRFRWWVTAVEMAAVFVATAAIGHPAAALGPVYAAVYLRCLYGGHLAAFGRALAYLTVVVVLAAVLDPPDQMQQPGNLASWAAPSLALTTIVVRILAVCLTQLTASRDINHRLAHAARALAAAQTGDEARSVTQAVARAIVPRAVVDLTAAGDPAPVRTGVHRVVLPVDAGVQGHGTLAVASDEPITVEQSEALAVLVGHSASVLDGLLLRLQLDHRASHDALTALPNRARFTESLVDSVARRPVAALFIDLDDFKTVNDTMGHAAGDALLAEVATRITKCLRPGDVAARLGGDEFAVLVDGVATAQDATGVAARILAALDEPYTLLGHLHRVRSSIGIAFGDPASEPTGGTASERAASVLRNADLAMYVAKARGKNRYEVYSDELAAAVDADRDIRHDMSAALSEDQFELHFQPIMTLADGVVRTVEALARWRHPVRGLLMPAEFLPQARRIGLMADLEQWVIAHACRAAAAWDGVEPPAVSINISPAHLASSWLVPTIERALGDSGLAAERLVIEVTEESLVDDPQKAGDNLAACRRLGVRVAMDDFGAGHASLTHLVTMPIDTIKIDRTLVNQTTGPVVVKAVVELAHALGLAVVAEGVEDDEQLRWLRETGCDAVQGFLLGRPTPAASLAPPPAGASPWTGQSDTLTPVA